MTEPNFDALRLHMEQVHSMSFVEGPGPNPIPLTLSNLRWLHRRFLAGPNNPNGCDPSTEKG